MADGNEPPTEPGIDERFDPAFQRGFTGSTVTRQAPTRALGSRPGYLQPAAPLAPPAAPPRSTSVAPEQSDFAPHPTAVVEPTLSTPTSSDPAAAPSESTGETEAVPVAPPDRGRPNPIDIGLWVLAGLLVVAAYFVGTRGAEIQAHGYFVQSDAYAFVFSQVMIGTAPLLLAVGLLLAITQLVRLSISWERKHKR